MCKFTAVFRGLSTKHNVLGRYVWDVYKLAKKQKRSQQEYVYQYHTHTHWQMTRVMLMQTNEKPESYIIGLVDVIIVQLLIIIVFAFK